MPNVKFNLRQRVKNEPTLIYLKFRYRPGSPLTWATRQKIRPKDWDFKKQRAKSSFKNPLLSDINAFLDKVEKTTLSIYTKAITHGENLRVAEFKQRLETAFFGQFQENQNSLLKFIPRYLEERKRRPGYKRGTDKVLFTWYNILKEYSEYKNKSIDYDQINWRWLEDFKNFLFVEKKESINYAAKGIEVIKQFVNEARRRGYTDNRIVTERGFSVQKIQTNKIVLYWDDLDKINNIDFSGIELYNGIGRDRLERVRDILIIGCYTGLRFNMIPKISKDLIKQGKGVKYIEVFTQKTDTKVAIPLLAPLERVLEKNDYRAPKMIHKEVNKTVKILCKLAGITEKVQWRESKGGKLNIRTREKWEVVTAHAFRRSFATNFYLLGFPESSLMKITGHSTGKQFHQYINVGDQLNAENFAKRYDQLKIEKPNFLKVAK
jgi:integrase